MTWFTAAALSVVLSLPALAQKRAARAKEEAASLPAVIWRDPGDIAALNVFYGEGGRRDAPDPKGRFTFVKEDIRGTNPKFDVTDERGRKWRVKLGGESRPETAATRLLWAAGYYVDEDYFVPELRVAGLRRLRRGDSLVSGDGIVRGARLELRRKSVHKLDEWGWFQNTFEGTRPFNGLRVMMCLIDNWDLKDDNNSVYEIDGRREYVVSDLGASFGKTGNYFTRSKGNVKDYSRAPFLARFTPDRVDFVMHSRPFFLTVFDFHVYRERTRMERIAKNIPVADARWIGRLLGELSPAQLRDCFLAAGYDPETADLYARALRKRIAVLNQL
jgi:hypothetical protein